MEAGGSVSAWRSLLKDFGPSSSTEKKKKRRSDVIQYVEPKESHLGLVKRFGHMPSFDKPIGWDGKNFRETFTTKELPFLTTEKYGWHSAISKFDNKLVWGDNLAVMRALPSESIDLIYIDPPFFSGRNYNCIFGDDDEVRTFSDIWDGGLPTYLAWLNARLWEMKRLLKPTGSIFVHLDWHATHYVKVELDKIFGYDNFLNELVWCYGSGGASKRHFSRKHDNILWYAKSDKYRFNCDEVREPYKEKCKVKYKVVNGKKYLRKNELGRVPFDWFEQPIITNTAKERIGYPTQKPEALIEKLVRASTKEGDVVADFFCGGGTTAVVAEKLGRRWITCDVSRIAVSVVRDRLASCYSKVVGLAPENSHPVRGFLIQNHGAYDKSQVRSLPEEEYIPFVLQCYESKPQQKGEFIHGFKADRAVSVSPARGKLTVDQVEGFHEELSRFKISNGIILAWSWDKDTEDLVSDLRQGSGGPDIQLVQVKLVDINSHEFKGENIRFLNKPAAVIRAKRVGGCRWTFDGSPSQGRNSTDIHYYQWDFNYKGRFNPMTKPNFKDDADNDGNPLNDNRKVEYEFPEHGIYRVALRVIDKSGAEATDEIIVDTKKKIQEAA